MKKNIFIINFLFIFFHLHTMAQTWQWARSFGGSSTSVGGTPVIFPNGDIYCPGSYQHYGNPPFTLIAGTDTLTGTYFNSFITEFDQSGNLISIGNIASTSNCIPNPSACGVFISGLVPGSADNIYISAQLQGDAQFDTIAVYGNNYHYTDILTRWNNNLKCQSAKSEDNGQNIGFAVNDFVNNNLYITGHYSGAATLDTIILNDSVTNHGLQTGLVGKLSSSGSCYWTKQAIGGNTNILWVGTDNNRFYMVGKSDSCFIFDTINMCGNAQNQVSCLFQTDTDGAVQWAQRFKSSGGSVYIGFPQVSKDGSCYVNGYFTNNLYIGGDSLHKAGNESSDGFLAKFDGFGNILWIKQIFGSIAPYGLAADSLGYCYVAGAFLDTAQVGSFQIIAQSATDLFVCRYDSSGNCMGVITLPNSQIRGIAEDSAGNAIVAGLIDSTVTFSGITLYGTSSNNFFIAKLNAITDTGTYISDLKPDSTLQIYANPNRGEFTVVVPQTIIQASTGNLTVYDYIGNIISSGLVELNTSHVQVELGAISKGYYNVLLTANNKRFVGTVIIE